MAIQELYVVYEHRMYLKEYKYLILTFHQQSNQTKF